MNPTYYIKGDKSSDIAVYNVVMGTKRVLTAAEWRVIKKVVATAVLVVVPQADYDSLPKYDAYTYKVS